MLVIVKLLMDLIFGNLMKKILFLLKRREDYNGITHSSVGLSTGLFNSASFMNNMMRDAGFESNMEVVIDNNCI
mgnify:CR=1 FL=1